MVDSEWSSAKSRANERKHGISFEEAQSMFYDDFARQFFDEEHSQTEERFIMLGMSNRSRVLIVCHCENLGGEAVRIISARKATRKERSYCEGPFK
jgi:uncharacterized DUF497 family protein